jgi:hypothetical protein
VEYDGMASHALPLPTDFQTSAATMENQKTLLPAKSLSHFGLHQIYTDHSELPVLRSKLNRNFPPVEPLTDASTRRVPSHKPVLVSKRSTLQIRRPESLHASISNASSAPSSRSENSSSSLRRAKRSGNLRECATAESFVSELPSLTPIAEHSPSLTSESSQEGFFHMVRHFASFCIIDIVAPGCPVSAVSEDLRYLYDIRDRFVLNAHQCSELSMDLSVGRDPNGNEVTYLLLFSPLVAPATLRNRFMLVSAIDVSGYVRYAANLETSSDPSMGRKSCHSFGERTKAKRKLSSVSWIDERTDQLADELLHGCTIKEPQDTGVIRSYRTLHTAELRRSYLESEDIWTAIAREEVLMSREASTVSRSMNDVHGASNPLSAQKQQQAIKSEASKSMLDYADEKVLGDFIEGLQVLYSQYFLLASSPLDEQFYEICYISPTVYASGEYISGHLSHMSLSRMNDFAAHLAAGKRFRTTIRWGNEGVEKKLYCIPLIGYQPAPWICMLVDQETPLHW